MRGLTDHVRATQGVSFGCDRSHVVAERSLDLRERQRRRTDVVRGVVADDILDEIVAWAHETNAVCFGVGKFTNDALTPDHNGSILIAMDPQAEQIVVRSRVRLSGEVTVPGAKNSVLKLMAATLLADGVTTLTNVPNIADVAIMGDLLNAIGVSSAHHPNDSGTLVLTHHGAITPVAPYELVERIRASINVLGPLLTRYGTVRLSLPGGDDFGSRPIDMHVAGLEAMGATFELHHGYLDARADRLQGAKITFEFPSVGASENLLTAAVLE